MTASAVSPRAQKLYDSALVWDAHAGVFPGPTVDLSVLDHWRDSGANYLSINIGFDVMDPATVMPTLAAYRRYVLAHPGRFVLAGTLADIERARAGGKLAISFDIEGMNALCGDINMVDVFHALGVRQMLFAYNLNNAAAGGCHDDDTGLTDFGKAIVQRMNDVGMIVDCTHVGPKTSMDIIARSGKPVVFSHSNPSAVWDHERNIADDQIRACADTGGVIGINGMGIFLGNNDISTETIVRHVCYVADLVGAQHVGFGFDYSPGVDIDVAAILKTRPDYWPPGNLYDTPNIGHAGPPQLPAVVDGLIARGFTDTEIRGMLGENFKRVAAAAWQD